MALFRYKGNFFPILTLIFLILTMAGCALNARTSISTLSTPEHHVFSGMKLLENGKLSDAEREFNLAKELDEKYYGAYRGLGLIFGYQGKFEQAFNHMSLAKELVKRKDEEALVYVGFMRLHTKKKGKGWLNNVEENFQKANTILKNIRKQWADPYFYMGLAYKEAYEFSSAAQQFKKALEINTNLSDKAYYELKLVEKIERAMPKTLRGKKIVLLEKMRRVDVAALLIQEIGLDKIYKKVRPSSTYQTPVPGDVVDHPLRKNIMAVIPLKIKGLSVFPNGRFEPNKSITRASYAMMIADIIGTLSNNPSLGTKYTGTVSPFTDVRNDVHYFNAIMVCTTEDIMKPEMGFRQEIFNPLGNVAGVDALLILRRMKEHLKIF